MSPAVPNIQPSGLPWPVALMDFPTNGMVKLTKLVQPLSAPSPIEVTESPKVAEVMRAIPRKAWSPMVSHEDGTNSSKDASELNFKVEEHPENA